MVNHSSRRVNKLVYNQYQEPISLAIATSDSLTCLYRLKYLNKIKRLGSSRRRRNKLKRFILSPQSLIDLGVKTFNNAAYYITNIRYGLQVNSSYRFLGIKGRVSYHNAANRYIVDRINIFTEEDLIKLELEKHFCPHGLKYPVVGLVYMGGLTSEVAREAYVNNRPYKNVCMPEACAEHAVVITGIYTDGEPERHFVEIKNCYGSEWGYEGYTKVVFRFIRSVMIPCIDDKKCMEKKSVGSLKESELKGKRVLVRSDLNVPLDDSFKITDDTRIRAAVPTIKYLMSNGARVILSSHLGRPKGVTAKLSLKPLVPRLSELLGIEVKMADDCVGPVVEKSVTEIPEGGVLLLENLRFYKEEENNDPEFAKKLASLADLYVNDAFGTAHRTHASTEGVAKHLKPSVAGFLMQKIVPAYSIPDGWMGLDIGPDSIKTFSESLDTAKTVIWNGPMGVVEFEKFAAGTEAIAHKLADLSGKGVTTIIRGGDLVAAVEKVGLADKMSYISTGGGASLELLEGRPLPGVLALDES